MQITGRFLIHASQQDVWEFLIDIPRMTVCIPGMRETVQVDEQTYTVAIHARLGAIAAVFQGTLAKTLEDAPQHLKVAVHLWDAKTASIITGDCDVQLAADGTQHTTVDYCFDLTLRGRLTHTEQGVAQLRFQEAVDQFAQCARTRIERPANEVFRRPPLTWLERLNQAFQTLIEKIRQI